MACGNVWRRRLFRTHTPHTHKNKQLVLGAFYRYWWPAPPKGVERRKVAFRILQGPHEGGAVAVVSSSSSAKASGSCAGQSPSYIHNHLGSSVFVYHGDAVAEFRRDVVAPFFAKLSGGKVSAAEFGAALSALKAKQLAASLRFIRSAAAVDVFGVSVVGV